MSRQPKSNIALLTEGAAYIKRAKAARQEQVDEIKFDDEARKEWLTGFSKRKKAKVDERRSRAKERDRQAHVDERRKMRQELRERAAQNVRDVRAAMGLEEQVPAEEGDEEDEENSEAGPSKPRQEEAEFSDEDQLATVTITEDFDPSSLPVYNPLRSSTSPGPEHASSARPTTSRAPIPLMPASSGRAQAKAKKEKDKVKEKKSREKERSRNMETKAERKKGKSMEAKKRGHKAVLAIERNGKSRGKGGPKRGGKAARGGASARGGSSKRGGKR